MPPCARNTCSKDVKLASNSAPALMATQGAPGPPFSEMSPRNRITTRMHNPPKTAIGTSDGVAWRSFSAKLALPGRRSARTTPANNQAATQPIRGAHRPSRKPLIRPRLRLRLGSESRYKHRHKPPPPRAQHRHCQRLGCRPEVALHPIGSGRLRRRSRWASITGARPKGPEQPCPASQGRTLQTKPRAGWSHDRSSRIAAGTPTPRRKPQQRSVNLTISGVRSGQPKPRPVSRPAALPGGGEVLCCLRSQAQHIRRGLSVRVGGAIDTGEHPVVPHEDHDHMLGGLAVGGGRVVRQGPGWPRRTGSQAGERVGQQGCSGDLGGDPVVRAGRTACATSAAACAVPPVR